MKLKSLHDPASGILQAIAFMSGSGTNLCKILEHEAYLKTARGNAPFHICAIFSDTHDSRATIIGRDYNLPVITRDIKSFYKENNTPRSDLALREVYDRETVKLLLPLGAKFAVYAGYMSIASIVLINAFLGINVHPADLSITEHGKRKWVGAHTVRDAILAGEQQIRASTHLVEPVVDGGRIFMLSPEVPVVLPPGADLKDKQQLKAISAQHQALLKEQGDWVIMPKTIEYLADGRYAWDETGMLYFDGQAIPQGLKLE